MLVAALLDAREGSCPFGPPNAERCASGVEKKHNCVAGPAASQGAAARCERAGRPGRLGKPPRDEPVDLVGDHAFLGFIARPLLCVLGERFNETSPAVVDRGESVEPLAGLRVQLDMMLGRLRQTSQGGRGGC